MIQKMQTDYHTSPDRVYITGLSAGGAMTAAALAAYPEVFKGGAIIAGVPYGCAETQGEEHDCMDGETDLSPEEWGKRVRAAAQGHVTGDGVPVVSIWHGGSDGMVNKVNARELVEQFTDVIGIDQVPDKKKTKGNVEYTAYADKDGKVMVEKYIIKYMNHGVPIDPQNGCGQVATVCVFDKGICSSKAIDSPGELFRNSRGE